MELEYTDKVAIIYETLKNIATIYKYDWRNEKSASRIVYSEHRNKKYDTRIVW